MKEHIKKKSCFNTAKNIHVESWQLLSAEASMTSYIISYELILKSVQFTDNTEMTDITSLT